MTDAVSSVRQVVSRNQGRLAILVLLFVCCYFIVIFGEQAWRANHLAAEIAQQRASIADIRRENAQLATRAEQMNSPAYNDYVEQIARRDLWLARPGETVVIVPRQSSASAPRRSRPLRRKFRSRTGSSGSTQCSIAKLPDSQPRCDMYGHRYRGIDWSSGVSGARCGGSATIGHRCSAGVGQVNTAPAVHQI